MRLPRRLLMTLLTLAAALAMVPPATGQKTATRLDEAAAALRSDPVYVDPNAERALSRREADRLREAIRRQDAGPLYIAVLPGADVEIADGVELHG